MKGQHFHEGVFKSIEKPINFKVESIESKSTGEFNFKNIKNMGQGSKQKNIHPYSIAIITVAILVFVVIAYSIFSYFTNERHSHGGGFKSIETPINFEAGIIEPGEVGESDIELKKK